MDNLQNNFLLYNTANNQVNVAVFLQDETVWLTQKSLSELFDTSTQNITIHLKNIYEDAELNEEATCKEILQVQMEGKGKISKLQADKKAVKEYDSFNKTQKIISDFDKEIKKLGKKNTN